MNTKRMTAAVLSLLCAAALTACGTDPITADITAETTVTAETTAETEAETTADTTADTTAAATTTAAETTTAESDAETTTAEETTTTEAEQTTEATEAQTEATTEAPKEEKNLFDALKIGGDPAEYLAAHSNYSLRESDSCKVNGKDRTYTFADFRLETVVENGKESVQLIDIIGSGIATREGIQVGSKAADAEKAYGAASDPDCYTYQTADGKLEIFIVNETVDEIVLSAAS